MDKRNKRPQRGGRKIVKEEPRKDSKDKRVNFDNMRESKFKKEFEGDPRVTNKSNDVRWYASNPELLKAAASYPFSYTTGMRLPFNNGYAVPGVLAVYYSPSLGGGITAPINQAKDSIYSFTVHANSRNQSYDAADEMILILAGMEVFRALAHAIRAYGTMKMYDQRNQYLPQALIKAMGFSFDDLKTNLSNMWFDINEMIARSTQIWIPNTMPVMERWFWMNSNIYMDAESIKSQYYLYVPRQFYQYNETASETGGSLQTTTWNPYVANTWANFKTLLNGMISALIDSSDRGLIFGDILKAYGKESIYAVQEIPSSYTVQPVYDREVLSQIENSTANGIMPAAITQTADGIINQAWTTGATVANLKLGTIFPRTVVLNFHQKETPTPEQIMVATRLQSASNLLYWQGTNLTEIRPVSSGTEIVQSYGIYCFNYATLTPGSTPNINVDTMRSYMMSNDINDGIISRWSAFDWAPWIYIGDPNKMPQSQTDTQPQPEYVYGDFDNYTLLTDSDLTKMHTTAVYSEFGVPVL